jgi:hypothetical protein
MDEPIGKPPRLVEKILGRLIDFTIRDQALGDFEEHFRRLAVRKGPVRARLWYGLQLVPVLKSFAVNSFDSGGAMLKSYIKTALRDIRSSSCRSR